MEDVVIIDNFLTNDELEFISDFFFWDIQWCYGHKSAVDDKIKWFVCNLIENQFFTEYLL